MLDLHRAHSAERDFSRWQRLLDKGPNGGRPVWIVDLGKREYHLLRPYLLTSLHVQLLWSQLLLSITTVQNQPVRSGLRREAEPSGVVSDRLCRLHSAGRLGQNGPMDPWGFTPEQRHRLLDSGQHLRTLSRIAAEALLSGALETAYACADRRCRLPARGQARPFLLRAEAARRLGYLAQARDDMRRAFELDPADRLVSLQALTLGDGAARTGAARAIVSDPVAPLDAIRSALVVLQREGPQIVGKIEAVESNLRGWITWPHGRQLHCTITSASGSEAHVLTADPAHPLTSEECQASLVTSLRVDSGPVQIRFFCAPSLQNEYKVVFPPLCKIGEDPVYQEVQPQDDLVDLTVIVPVYEDADATRTCLDSLAVQELPGKHWRTIVVNDASPNPRLVSDLNNRADQERFTLITNASNLGFAAAINRGVAQTRNGDLLLLNADTILPPGSLARLHAHVAATPRLGTVTPLSNNGVVTSFPNLFTVNDLPSLFELSAWDRAAAAANPPPIDLPNGIGFCLLITRACWQAVGGMPLSYGQGYYEDVDFCLSARQHGFRNLCATNVVIGHAGSASFGSTKRELVVRNAAALDLRYPEYRSEIEAFRVAEPLRPAFAVIERRLEPPQYDILILNSNPTRSPALSAQLTQWEAGALRCLFAEVDELGPDLSIRLRGGAGRLPQSLTFDLTSVQEREDLWTYLRATHLKRVVMVAPERCPQLLRDLALELGAALDLFLSGAGLKKRLDSTVKLPTDGHTSWDEEPPYYDATCERDVLSLASRAERLICSDRMTLASVQDLLSPPVRRKLVLSTLIRANVAESPEAPSRGPGVTPTLPGHQRPLLGILSPVPTAEVTRLVLALGAHLRQVGAEMRLLIIGGSLNDLALMAGRATFVSGPVAAADTAALVAYYQCTALLLPYRDRLFECLEAATTITFLPRAFFDWSHGAYTHSSDDLALDPMMADTDAASQIVPWLVTRPKRPS